MQRIPSIWVCFTTQSVIQNGSVFRYQTHTSGHLYIGGAPPGIFSLKLAVGKSVIGYFPGVLCSITEKDISQISKHKYDIIIVLPTTLLHVGLYDFIVHALSTSIVRGHFSMYKKLVGLPVTVSGCDILHSWHHG